MFVFPSLRHSWCILYFKVSVYVFIVFFNFFMLDIQNYGCNGNFLCYSVIVLIHVQMLFSTALLYSCIHVCCLLL